MSGDSFFLLDTEDLPASINAISDAFSYFHTFEEHLLRTVYDGGNLQDLIDIAEPYFNNPMFIANWQGEVFAYTKGFAEDFFRPAWRHIVMNNRLLLSSIHTLRNSPSNYSQFANDKSASIFEFQEENFACIIGWMDSMLDYHLAVSVMQHKTAITETTCVMANTFLDVMKRICPSKEVTEISSVFRKLLDGSQIGQENLDWALVTLGWKRDEAYLLLNFRSNEGSLMPEVLCGELRQHISRGLHFLWNGQPVMLIREADFKQTRAEIEHVIHDLSFHCGVSLPFTDWERLPLQFRQAENALVHCNGQNNICSCADYVWQYIFNELETTLEDLQLCHPAVITLSEYDHKKDAKLLPTLYAYLANERSLSTTANKLYIHKNTLLHRLHLIRDLVDIDLDDNGERLHILISCNLYLRHVDAT